jgi:hypothetical protein
VSPTEIPFSTLALQADRAREILSAEGDHSKLGEGLSAIESTLSAYGEAIAGGNKLPPDSLIAMERLLRAVLAVSRPLSALVADLACALIEGHGTGLEDSLARVAGLRARAHDAQKGILGRLEDAYRVASEEVAR